MPLKKNIMEAIMTTSEYYGNWQDNQFYVNGIYPDLFRPETVLWVI